MYPYSLRFGVSVGVWFDRVYAYAYCFSVDRFGKYSECVEGEWYGA